jgi:hypothetical protein
MAVDFEMAAMVLAILILGSNAMLGYTSDYFYGTDSQPMNFLQAQPDYDYNAQYRYDQSRGLQPQFDANVTTYAAAITTPLSYIASSLQAFGVVGKMIFNVGLGTQQSLFIVANGFKGMGVLYNGLIAIVWIIVGIISAIETLGLFYIIVRFVSLVRGGGGV